MAKILSCPNCGNNKNLVTNNNTTICSSCGYSWVSVSNRNIKSSEIKVVMDSANHYRYTLDNYSDDEHTFPFYAIHNDFIENKNSNRNRLIRVNPLDEKSVKQSYVGVSKLKPKSKRPIIRYSDNVDLSMYHEIPHSSQRVVSDRTNQEYEILKDGNNFTQKQAREHNSKEHSNREHNKRELGFKEHFVNLFSKNLDNSRDNYINNRETSFSDRPTLTQRPQNSVIKDTTINERNPISEREHIYIKKSSSNKSTDELNYLNEFAEKDPERFFSEYEVTKVNDDGSVEVQPREILSRENRLVEQDSEKNQKNSTTQKNSQEYNNNYSDNSWQTENSFDKPEQNNTSHGTPFNHNLLENDFEYIRPEPKSPRIKKERLSEEQKIYKAQLRERLERSQKQREEHRIREQTAREHGEQEDEKSQTTEPLTYEKYKEKRNQKIAEAKEQQKARSERIKNKDYIPRASINKYQRTEKKYYRKNIEDNIEQNKPIKDYREKYLNKDVFETENFNRENLENNHVSKKLRSEIENIEKKSQHFEPKVYEKKLKVSKNINQSKPSNAYNPSNLDEMINNNAEIDENLLNAKYPKKLFGKNPRLSFFENLKINNDGTIKEDPLGLNQDYNEFFNKNDLALGEKKYNLKEIIHEIKKRINKDKMSFNLVILVIIFGFFGMLSHFITKSHLEKNNNKMITELDLGKDFTNQVKSINDKSKAKGANGTSDALVIGKALQDPEAKEIINTISEKDSHQILLQGKKNIASDLSLEELRNNKISDLDKNKDNKVNNTTSFMSKTMMYFQQKATQIFSDVNVSVVSSKWQVDESGKYFEINFNLNNKSTNRSYTINTLKITLLDVSGNIIGIREFYPNKTLRIKETAISSIRIPKAPDLSANAYIKITDIR